MNKNLIFLLSSIKNSLKNGSKTVKIKKVIFKCKLCTKILHILEKEGLIKSFQLINHKNNKVELIIYLKYNLNNLSTIKNITLISKPSKRIYISSKLLWNMKTSFTTFIISTSKGIMTDKEARLKNKGGELLFSIV